MLVTAQFFKTAHSVLSIPVRLSETSVSNITPSSQKGQKLKEIDTFICNEVTMNCYSALDLADKLLREVMRDNRPFGEKLLFSKVISASVCLL